MSIDLNADLGEGAPSDGALLEVITSANIACGGHAGDEETMRTAVRAAQRRGVGIGAHPSFPDREGFGRHVVDLPRQALVASLAGQIGVLRRIARGEGAALAHVKAHGALYNVAVDDRGTAQAIGEAVRSVDPDLLVVALAGSPMVDAFRAMGLSVVEEAFVDRGYTPEGRLVPRSHSGALVTDPQKAAARAVRMVREGVVTAVDGTELRVRPRTLCIHADTPGSPGIAAAARAALEAAGIGLARMAR
ncbi:MAG TPA: 5-oxoprolinase subunit PxpA [bacterium]|nr:5-oxoprolinase subunit PxpA [bacterium]